MPQASSPDDQQLIVAGTSAPPRPRRSPGNDITLMTASLISVLQVEDAKHDVLQSGGQFFLDLPSRLGHNPMLDASAKALVSSYHYVHTRNLDGPTLANYGRALEQLRVGMQDCSYSVAVKLYAVILTVFTQVRPRRDRRGQPSARLYFSDYPLTSSLYIEDSTTNVDGHSRIG